MQQASNPYAAQNQAQNHYQRMQITTADPFELVLILYRGAIQNLNSAAEHMREGRIQERVHHINKAQDMIAELKVTLDFEKGQDIAKQLDRLYGYMMQRLTEANARQDVQILKEVTDLLKTLQGAWEEARQNMKNGQPGQQPDSAGGRAAKAATAPAETTPHNGDQKRQTSDAAASAGASQEELQRIRLSA